MLLTFVDVPTMQARKSALLDELDLIARIESLGNGTNHMAVPPETPTPSPKKRTPRAKPADKTSRTAGKPRGAAPVMETLVAILAESGRPHSTRALYRAAQDRIPNLLWKTPILNIADFAQRSHGRIRRNMEGEWIAGAEVEELGAGRKKGVAV